ncbi:MAG: class I SAM-dependent methyltransferase [Gammaproteobacteria bacterium]|nr:class I SAM-dependent methyltransferase [Gammaproteobacteria bacterium]
MCKRIFCVVMGLSLLACTPGGLVLDPERSAEMAGSAREASTQPTPPLMSEAALKPPGARPEAADVAELAVLSALANEERPGADRARDASRQSAAVLRFFGVTPGMTVLDLYSGGGYYTEILSRLVGPKGRVVAHNNTPYLRFAGAELATRYAGGRGPNVEQLIAENNALSLPAATFDVVLMTNVYHDVYLVDEQNGWARIDAPKMLATILASMRPGAVLGVVDHVAAPGSSLEQAAALHRIDPGQIRRDLLAAGFVLDGESDVLRNPGDDGSRPVFDPDVRGHTNQVVLRFRRPR